MLVGHVQQAPRPVRLTVLVVLTDGPACGDTGSAGLLLDSSVVLLGPAGLVQAEGSNSRTSGLWSSLSVDARNWTLPVGCQVCAVKQTTSSFAIYWCHVSSAFGL